MESVDNSSLGEGDVFDVRVYGEEELSGTYRVANDGSIDFPFIGNLRVAHMEPPAVAQAIRKALQDGGYLRQPQVSVLLKESNSKRISVVGAVQQPGTFPYTPGLTVVQAVSLAGGFNTIANKNQTIVTRRRGSKRVRFRVLVEEVTRGRAEDPALKAGDIVYVPERLF
ncbi:MAG: polysaccharide biosynthesis/export family protein [Polyangiales bacterium]